MHVPVTFTLSITEGARTLDEATVRLQLPSSMVVHDTQPEGWSYSSGWYSRTVSPMEIGHNYSFDLLVESIDVFDDWIVARVEPVPEPPDGWLYTDTSLQVRVTAGGAEVSYADLDGLGLADFTETHASEDLDMSISLYPLPSLTDTTTVTFTVTNRDRSPHSYVADLSLPASWVLISPSSSEWGAVLAGYESDSRQFVIRSAAAQEWTIAVALHQTGNATHNITYHGNTDSTGLSMFGGSEYTRSPCIPTPYGGCGDFNQHPCQAPSFSIRGNLWACTANRWTQGSLECSQSSPSKETLMQLVIRAEPAIGPPCAYYWYEYYTNTDHTGAYEFTDIPFFPGWYFVHAYATDASSFHAENYDVWVAPGSCPWNSPCVQSRYLRRVWEDHLETVPLSGRLDVPPFLVPHATSYKTLSNQAPGGAFRIQTLVATVSAPYVDSLGHWQREQGRYRARYRYPEWGKDYNGGGLYLGTEEWGANIVLGGPNFYDGTVHHEYGHHTMGVHHWPTGPGVPGTDNSRLMEGWAEFYKKKLMGTGAQDLEGDNGGWSDTCPVETHVSNQDAEAQIVAGLFWDMDDQGTNECFDSVSDSIAAVYDVFVRRKPDYVCDFIAKWDVWPLDPPRRIWQYHGYNPFGGPKLPDCP